MWSTQKGIVTAWQVERRGRMHEAEALKNYMVEVDCSS
jgi:hypothetical protein